MREGERERYGKMETLMTETKRATRWKNKERLRERVIEGCK